MPGYGDPTTADERYTSPEYRASEVHVFVLLRHELNVAVLNRFHRRFRQHVCTHIPLVGQHRFDNNAATVAVRDGQIVRFNFFQQAERVNGSNDGLTGSKAFQLWNSAGISLE